MSKESVTAFLHRQVDRIEKLESELTRLREERDRYRKALQYIADKENYRSPSTGFALQYDPEPSPISNLGGSVTVAQKALSGNEKRCKHDVDGEDCFECFPKGS